MDRLGIMMYGRGLKSEQGVRIRGYGAGGMDEQAGMNRLGIMIQG